MWGYALLGLATWFVAPVFDGGSLERAARWTFVANGPLSIGAALVTAMQPGWELGLPGMLAFASWNLLVVVMTILAAVVLRRRLGEPRPASNRGARAVRSAPA